MGGHVTLPEHLTVWRTLERMSRRNWNRVDFLLSVGILIVSRTSTGSIQSVPGTVIVAGDTKKLTRIKSPPRTAAGGTLLALPTCLTLLLLRWFCTFWYKSHILKYTCNVDLAVTHYATGLEAWCSNPALDNFFFSFLFLLWSFFLAH